MVVEDVRDAARASGLLAGDPPLVAMISGGRDSTCLLDVLVAVGGRDAVAALHVNYGLRDDAAADERHCEALCERLGVALEVHRAEGPARGGADLAQGNLQAWARDVRYAAAARLARERAALVATGHTASDQVETILYRLAASPGRRALLGMPADARLGAGAGERPPARLIRPLLGVEREQTAAYCRARGLEWREDASNDDRRFARARVRHELLAALRAVHPAAEANVLRTAALLGDESAALDALVEHELGGEAALSVARLEELPAAIARLIVVRMAEAAAETYVPQAGERVAEILALARRGGRAEVHVGGLVAAVVDGGTLEMVRLEPRRTRPSGPSPDQG